MLLHGFLIKRVVLMKEYVIYIYIYTSYPTEIDYIFQICVPGLPIWMGCSQARRELRLVSSKQVHKISPRLAQFGTEKFRNQNLSEMNSPVTSGIQKKGLPSGELT